MSRAPIPSTLLSERVPTEYNVEIGPRGLPTLVDDRSRRFTGLTLKRAFKKAERAQDPRDSIHHPPFPDPREVPEPWA